MVNVSMKSGEWMDVGRGLENIESKKFFDSDVLILKTKSGEIVFNESEIEQLKSYFEKRN